MIPTSVASPANTQSVASAVIGITSLIFEGRALSDDEFITSYPQNAIQNSPDDTKILPTNVSHHPINLTGTYLQHQRLRQKLGQLRQSSPGTSRDYYPEQSIAIGLNKCGTSISTDSDVDDDDKLLQFVQRKQKPTQVSDNKLLITLQSLASSCLRTTNRSRNQLEQSAFADDWWNRNSVDGPSSFKEYVPSTSNTIAEGFYLHGKSNNRGEKIIAPKQGPHCDHFLKKMGFYKGDATEIEEHICDMAGFNEICCRWQLHCQQIDFIMSRSDPICIEIYLGPENHEILLEQWIIHQKEKSSAPNMTLQSLLNAIRSQLYFSQISAWTDLIKNAKPYDKDILDSVRIKKFGTKQKRLDILYRIKAYDSTACFNTKPNIHNFPNVIISENCSISVCLKSLPRIQGGIPKIEDLLPNSNNESLDQSNSSCDETMVLDDRLNLPCQEKGKHKCAFDEEDGNSDAVLESLSTSNMSHREKQLQKYRKRIMKRDKKTKKTTETMKCDQQQQQQQPMQLEEKLNNDDNHRNEFGSINSIRPPLYQTTTSIAEAVQTNAVEMVSVGTQTANFPFPNCEICGNEMEFFCLECDKKSFQSNGDTSKMAKGDILLQAIERTPRHKIHDFRNNNNTKTPSISNDCQLCKRQKTQHHYRLMDKKSDEIVVRPATITSTINSISNHNNNNLNYVQDKCMYPSDTSKSQFLRLVEDDCECDLPSSPNSRLSSENTVNRSSTSGNSEGYSNGSTSNIVTDPNELKFCDDIDAQFKTPKTHCSPKNQLKPTPLYINCSGDKKLPPSLKTIPKINLNNIFNSQSAPIAIVSDPFNFDNINPEIPVQKSNSAPTLPNSPSLSPRFLKQAAIYKRRSRHLSDRSSERLSIGSDEQYSDEDLESLYSPTTSPIKSRMFPRASKFGRKPFLGNFEESLLQKRFIPKSQVTGFKVLLGASGQFCPTQLTIPTVAYFYELQGEAISTPYMCEIRLPRKGYQVPRVGTVQATLLNPLGTVVRMFVIPYDFRDMPNWSQTFIRQRILAVEPDPIDADSKPIGKDTLSGGLCHSDMSFGEQMRSLRYAIHLRFQTSRSGRITLHTDIRLLISRRTDCDTAAAHAKGALESPNELRILTITPEHPKYSSRQENPNKI